MASSSTIRNVPRLNLKAQHQGIREEVFRAITGVNHLQRLILGSEVKSSKQRSLPIRPPGMRWAVLPGSDALILALLLLGVQPGDEVLPVPHTF
ncbi:MAG: hypothetical protein ABI806_00500 [Candidatus Solibacter sp.]